MSSTIGRLRGLNPNNPASAPDRGARTRLIAKARRALTLGQYEAASSWLDEATSIGYESGETTAVRPIWTPLSPSNNCWRTWFPPTSSRW